MSENLPDMVLSMVEAATQVPSQLEIIPTDPAKLPAVMVHTETASEAVKLCKDGGGLYRYRANLYYRLRVDDDDDRIGAQSALLCLADELCHASHDDPPDIEVGKVKRDGFPVLVEATDDYETYMVTVEVKYYQARN